MEDIRRLEALDGLQPLLLPGRVGPGPGALRLLPKTLIANLTADLDARRESRPQHTSVLFAPGALRLALLARSPLHFYSSSHSCEEHAF